MIKGMRHALLRGEEKKKIDPRFIEAATDFIRAYADRFHYENAE